MRPQCCAVMATGQCSDCPLTVPIRPTELVHGTYVSETTAQIMSLKAALAARDAEIERLRKALAELVECNEIVKHKQHETGGKARVKGGRWKAAWKRAADCLAAERKDTP